MKESYAFVEIEDEFGIYVYYEFHQYQPSYHSDPRYFSKLKSLSKSFKIIFPDGSSGSSLHGGHGVQNNESYFRIFFSYGDMDGGNDLLQRIQSICDVLGQRINMEVEYKINSTNRGKIGFAGNDNEFLQRKDVEKKGIQVILYIE